VLLFFSSSRSRSRDIASALAGRGPPATSLCSPATRPAGAEAAAWWEQQEARIPYSRALMSGEIYEREKCGWRRGSSVVEVTEMLREKCLDWREDMGDVGCCWEAGKKIRSTAEWGSQVDSCIPLSSSSPFYFRVQGDVLNCYLY